MYYTYMCICIHTHIYLFICTYKSIYMYTYMCVYIYICVYSTCRGHGRGHALPFSYERGTPVVLDASSTAGVSDSCENAPPIKDHHRAPSICQL